MPQIKLEEVSKSYVIHEREPGFAGALRGLVRRQTRIIQAVDRISFSMEEGEMAAYIGPNGAGKSTAIKLMSGILCPDGGAIEIMGRTPWKQREKHVAEIGVVFGQKSQLWWDTPAIDSFEVWYGGTQIGARTDVGTELRHLAMDYKDTSKLTIRLYNGDTYVDECEVDASVPRDVLPIEGVTVEETERVVGTYTVETSVMGDTAVSQLTLSVDAALGADSYTLGYGGGQVYTAEKHPLQKPFHYFTLLVASLEDVTATLYNADGEKLTDVRFDTQTQTLVMVSGAE